MLVNHDIANVVRLELWWSVQILHFWSQRGANRVRRRSLRQVLIIITLILQFYIMNEWIMWILTFHAINLSRCIGSCQFTQNTVLNVRLHIQLKFLLRWLVLTVHPIRKQRFFNFFQETIITSWAYSQCFSPRRCYVLSKSKVTVLLIVVSCFLLYS